MADVAQLVITSDTLSPRLNAFPEKLQSTLAAAVYVHSIKCEGYMRSNAPWQDITGNARNGLRASPESAPDHHSIWLMHTVPYGIWLEVRWEGKYAIIVPTMKTQGRALMQYLRGVFRRFK